MKIILASRSPYRRNQLEQLGLTPEIDPGRINEDALKDASLDPSTLAQKLSEAKGLDVAARHPHDLVISGDQVAWFRGQVLNKAGSYEKAKQQLLNMAGHWHELHSALTLMHKGLTRTHVDVTRVRFKHLSEQEVDQYLKLDQSWDCAASYKFEKAGPLLIEKIETQDPSAIIGVPLIAFHHMFYELLGVSILTWIGQN